MKALEESVTRLKNENDLLKEKLNLLGIYSIADNLAINTIPEVIDPEEIPGWVAREGDGSGLL